MCRACWCTALQFWKRRTVDIDSISASEAASFKNQDRIEYAVSFAAVLAHSVKATLVFADRKFEKFGKLWRWLKLSLFLPNTFPEQKQALTRPGKKTRRLRFSPVARSQLFQIIRSLHLRRFGRNHQRRPRGEITRPLRRRNRSDPGIHPHPLEKSPRSPIIDHQALLPCQCRQSGRALVLNFINADPPERIQIDF